MSFCHEEFGLTRVCSVFLEQFYTNQRPLRVLTRKDRSRSITVTTDGQVPDMRPLVQRLLRRKVWKSWG